MWAASLLISSGLLVPSLATDVGYSIDNQLQNMQALNFLRVRRKNSGFFEETRDDDFKRECVDEMCSREELREIFPNDDARVRQTWKQFTMKCYLQKCNAEGTSVCIQTWNKRQCKCRSGWTGDDCGVDVDECDNGGTLCGEDRVCTNTRGSYTCGCMNGYTYNDATAACDDVDECEQDPDRCGADQVCKNVKGSFNCNCHTGYARNAEGKCTDIDECQDTTICSADEKCVNNAGSYTCHCDKKGYKTLDNGKCEDIDECKNVNCGFGTCQNHPGDYTCFCNYGYEQTGDFESRTCTPICPEHQQWTGANCVDKNVDGEDDPCDSVICGKEQLCDAGKCKCSNPGTESRGHLCIDIDECDSDPSPCDNEEKCENTMGSYVCLTVADDGTLPTFTVNPTTAKSKVVVTVENDTEPPLPTEGPVVPATQKSPPKLPESSRPTFKKEDETPLPSANNPESVLPPGQCHTGFEWIGDKSSGECSDVDECQEIDPMRCEIMCMNYYGKYLCYEELSEEPKMCHHYHQSNSSESGYNCACYDGYHLCFDLFTCVADDGYSEYERNGRFVYNSPGQDDCAAGQVGLNNKCYEVFDDPKSYRTAQQVCYENGGRLALIEDRYTWWVLGNSIGGGYVPFWVNQKSEANIHVFERAHGRPNMLVNLAQNMDHVPPQWDVLSGKAEHSFICEIGNAEDPGDYVGPDTGDDYDDEPTIDDSTAAPGNDDYQDQGSGDEDFYTSEDVKK